MARGAPIYAGTYAARGVAAGLNATEALGAFRAAGGGIRTQSWYSLWGQADLALDQTSAEIGQPLNRVPVRGQLPTITTRSKTGIQQRVRVFGFDKEGRWDSRAVTVRTKNGISRGSAIRQAIAAVNDSDQYNLSAVAGAHIGSYEEVPGETSGVGGDE